MAISSVGYCSTMFSLRHLLQRILLVIALCGHFRSYSLAATRHGVLMNPLPTDSQITWSGSTIAYFTGRNLLQQQSNQTGEDRQNGTYEPLVARNRIDPLNHFKRYKGGYNIESRHYWGSTIFTGVYGYAIAAIWIIVGLVYGIFLTIRYCCCNKRTMKGSYKPHSCRYYVWPFLAVILLTIAAIIASAVVLAGNSKFHTRAKRVEKTIVGAAQRATDTIYNVTSSMKTMQDQLQPYDENAYLRLNSTAERLNKEAANIHNRVFHNKRAIDIGVRVLNIVTIALASIILALVIFAIAILLLHWRHVFFLVIFVCWLLTALTWLVFGVYFAIHTFADDSCIALKDYQSDPYNTTLNSILPCVDLQAADSSLAEVREEVHLMIGQLNKNISRLQALNIQSLNIPYVCDPFSGPPKYEYTPDICSNGTIQIGSIPQLLESFKCSENDTAKCNSEGKYLTQSQFDEAEAYATSVQSLLDIFPALESLTNCSFVNDTFSNIANEQCHPVKSSINRVWSSLVALSTVLIFLLISWIVKAYQNGGRQISKGCVIPNNTPSATSSPKTQQYGHKTRVKMQSIHANSPEPRDSDVNIL